MRGPPGAAVSVRRACRAATFVGALLVGTLLAGVLTQVARPSVLGEAAQGDVWESRVDAALGIEGALEADRAPDALPSGFECEVGVPEGCSDVRVEEREGGGVAGFVVSAGAEETYASLRDGFTARGWTVVESGQANSGSFSKGSGAFRWAFASCAETGASTSVVVQYATANEGS